MKSDDSTFGYVSVNALMEFARNHVDRKVDCNDIARFPRSNVRNADEQQSLQQIFGIPFARLRELAEAERDGCVVALPFKIGDKAYWITHFGKMKASGTVVDILIRARDVLVGIDTENGSGTRKSIKDILYFQEAYTEQKGEAT